MLTQAAPDRATSFIDALLGSGVPLVAEIKPRSASGVDLLRGRSAAELVAAYQRLGAACVSVVTGRWFGGSEALLEEVIAHSRVPVLQKDFVVRRAQLARARSRGVSAVLLTAELTSARLLRRLIEWSLEENLTPFVEVTRSEQLEALIHAPACVVAVSNKEIRDAERGAAKLERSTQLLAALLRTGTRCPVSASGIARPADARALLGAGYRGLLIGTALLESDDLSAWAAACRRSPAS